MHSDLMHGYGNVVIYEPEALPRAWQVECVGGGLVMRHLGKFRRKSRVETGDGAILLCIQVRIRISSCHVWRDSEGAGEQNLDQSVRITK